MRQKSRKIVTKQERRKEMQITFTKDGSWVILTSTRTDGRTQHTVFTSVGALVQHLKETGQDVSLENVITE